MANAPVLERLKETVLIGDGAMGSLLYHRGYGFSTCYDNLNLDKPEEVLRIHREYASAGAQIIQTNTYGASRTKLAQHALEGKVREINARGVELARMVANGGDNEAYVAGSVGPLLNKPNKLTTDDMRAEFAEQIGAIADAGCDFIIMETFVSLDELLTGLAAARDVCDLPVFCTMAFSENGATPVGVGVTAALRGLEGEADGVGANANAGPLGTKNTIARMAEYTEMPILAHPASSMPQYFAGANFYLSHPDYFASLGADMVEAGANIVGGCIGTTPADIAALAARVRDAKPVTRSVRALPDRARVRPEGYVAEHYPSPGSIIDAQRRHKAIVVEVDPPRSLDYRKQIAGVLQLKEAGVDAITVADNSLATIRMDAMVMSHIYQEECGVRAVMHISCRDRNLIGMQSYLMGAQAMGITNVLCITGDPASVGSQEGATSVYDLNSVKLLRVISRMNSGENLAGDDLATPTSFVKGVALDANTTRLEPRLKRLKRKIDSGADFAMTQPMYDVKWAKSLYDLTAPGTDWEQPEFPIYIGIMPLVSDRNARFLHNEVPGISIPQDVIDRMDGLRGKEARRVGRACAREIIDATFDQAPGFYFIAPFENANYVLPLVEYVREKEREPARV